MVGIILLAIFGQSQPHESGNVSGRVTCHVDRPFRCDLGRSIKVDNPCSEEVGGKVRIEDESFVRDPATLALMNVIVYVRENVERRADASSGIAATLVHEGCRYHPHAQTIQVNQPLEYRNLDATVHHESVASEKNQELNVTWSMNRELPRTRVFKVPEIIRFRCDVHPWELAIVGIFDHPFHTVTAKDGTFEIKGLPPGKYTLVAWHEVLGEAATAEVTVIGGETKEANIEIKGK